MSEVIIIFSQSEPATPSEAPSDLCTPVMSPTAENVTIVFSPSPEPDNKRRRIALCRTDSQKPMYRVYPRSAIPAEYTTDDDVDYDVEWDSFDAHDLSIYVDK